MDIYFLFFNHMRKMIIQTVFRNAREHGDLFL